MALKYLVKPSLTKRQTAPGQWDMRSICADGGRKGRERSKDHFQGLGNLAQHRQMGNSQGKPELKETPETNALKPSNSIEDVSTRNH